MSEEGSSEVGEGEVAEHVTYCTVPQLSPLW